MNEINAVIIHSLLFILHLELQELRTSGLFFPENINTPRILLTATNEKNRHTCVTCNRILSSLTYVLNSKQWHAA